MRPCESSGRKIASGGNPRDPAKRESYLNDTTAIRNRKNPRKSCILPRGALFSLPMNLLQTRRQFLSHSATAAGLTLILGGRRLFAKDASPNNKLNIGVIGTAGRAASNIDGIKSQNIVAACDIDDNYLAKIQTRFPGAKTYNDFRKLLDQPGLDAVVVSTADHTHAVATAGALHRGLNVYCEKPLTHSVHEARTIAALAKASGKATQMGTQIHAGANYRRVVELVQSGAIGPIGEVHVWVGKGWGGGELPTDTPPVPENLHWDLWLGPAPERPYNPTYLPANWRRWWDFGNGTLGDMGCHYIDLPFWALKLRHPSAIEAEGPPVHPETCPTHAIVHYEFPARDTLPPVKLSWYDGGQLHTALLEEHKLTDKKGGGVLFIGEKGVLFSDYDHHQLLPAEKFTDFQPPAPSIPDSAGHYEEWITACKTGSPTTCNFDYSGALSETVLLGNVAYRTGKRIEWDAEKMTCPNAPEAEAYLRREYRPGWKL